jgi:hypothetical protein
MFGTNNMKKLNLKRHPPPPSIAKIIHFARVFEKKHTQEISKNCRKVRRNCRKY